MGTDGTAEHVCQNIEYGCVQVFTASSCSDQQHRLCPSHSPLLEPLIHLLIRRILMSRHIRPWRLRCRRQARSLPLGVLDGIDIRGDPQLGAEDCEDQLTCLKLAAGRSLHRAAAKSSSSGRFFTTAAFLASSISRFAFSVISMFLNRLLRLSVISMNPAPTDSLHTEIDLGYTRQHPQTIRYVPLLILPLLPVLRFVPLRDFVQLGLRVIRFDLPVRRCVSASFLQLGLYVC